MYSRRKKEDLFLITDFNKAQKLIKLEIQNAKYDIKSSIKEKQLCIKERMRLNNNVHKHLIE